MKIHYCLIAILLFIVGCTRSKVPGEWIGADIFFNPPVDYRSAPFYSLNDKLDTAEVIRQIKSF